MHQKSDMVLQHILLQQVEQLLTCGDYKIHTFTGPGTFTVSSVGNPAVVQIQ
jgi:hypothetical protein